MDDRRFDDLTKFVGRRASRRAVVKGAAVAALAAVFGRAAGGDDVAEAAIYQQGGVKQRIRVYCNQAGQKCKDSKNPTRRCCYRCNGSLTNPNSKCCETEGFACITDSHCCDGRICRDPNLFDGVNIKGCFDRGDLDYGAQCLDSSECATNICLSGVCCTEEQSCDDPYTGTGTCCGACETCADGACVPIKCEVCTTCNEETGVCESSCPAGSIPLEENCSCALPCSVGTECAGTSCDCAGADEGNFCMDPSAHILDGCVASSPCPAGWACVSGDCFPLCGLASG